MPAHSHDQTCRLKKLNPAWERRSGACCMPRPRAQGFPSSGTQRGKRPFETERAARLGRSPAPAGLSAAQGVA